MGRLAVDPVLVEQQAARRHQHVGVGGEADQLRRSPRQLPQRQKGVALLLGLAQREGGGGLGAAARLGRDVGGEGDPVGAGEADAGDLGQPVGVLVQDRHRALAEAGVDRCCEVGEPCGASCTWRSRTAREACQDSAAAAAWSALTPRSEPKTPTGSAAIAPSTPSPYWSTRRSARVGPMWRSEVR